MGRLVGAGRDEMSAAESGQEVIQRHLVGQIRHREPEHRFVVLGVEQIVGAYRDVKEISWLHAIRIVIVILGASLRQGQQCRRYDGAAAGAQRILEGCVQAAACQADVRLLGGGQLQGCGRIRDARNDQSAVVAPDEGAPQAVLTALIAEVAGLLESLIVIDPEDTRYVRSSLENQPAHLRRKVTGASVSEVGGGLEAVQADGAEPAG